MRKEEHCITLVITGKEETINRILKTINQNFITPLRIFSIDTQNSKTKHQKLNDAMSDTNQETDSELPRLLS